MVRYGIAKDIVLDLELGLFSPQPHCNMREKLLELSLPEVVCES
jgi:hypothetical protein